MVSVIWTITKFVKTFVVRLFAFFCCCFNSILISFLFHFEIFVFFFSFSFRLFNWFLHCVQFDSLCVFERLLNHFIRYKLCAFHFFFLFFSWRIRIFRNWKLNFDEIRIVPIKIKTFGQVFSVPTTDCGLLLAIEFFFRIFLLLSFRNSILVGFDWIVPLSYVWSIVKNRREKKNRVQKRWIPIVWREQWTEKEEWKKKKTFWVNEKDGADERKRGARRTKNGIWKFCTYFNFSVESTRRNVSRNIGRLCERGKVKWTDADNSNWNVFAQTSTFWFSLQ